MVLPSRHIKIQTEFSVLILCLKPLERTTILTKKKKNYNLTFATDSQFDIGQVPNLFEVM